MHMEFSRDRGGQVEKSWNFQGWGSTVKPPGMKNPGGSGFKLEKTLRGGDMDIYFA